MSEADKTEEVKEEAVKEEETEEEKPEQPEEKDGATKVMSKAKKEALSKRIRQAASRIKRKSATSDSEPSTLSVRKKKSPVTHPRTLDMAIEAIEKLDDRRGASVAAIRAYILETYPTVRADMIKSMLKLGFEQGFKESLLTRPRGQENIALLAGRYKVTKKGGKQAFLNQKKAKSKAKAAAPPKVKAAVKPKATAAKVKAAVKPKVTAPPKAKAAVKPKASAKAKKSTKVAVKVKATAPEPKKPARKPPTNRTTPIKKQTTLRKKR